MKTGEVLKCIGETEFLDKVYQYAYRRCNTSHEAEDLCSEIVLALVSSACAQETVENFYGFVWTIARRVYADHVEKRSKIRQMTVSEWSEQPSAKNEIESFLDEEADRDLLRKILSEISFLSKSYREVMVLYYVDGRKTKEIAWMLGITETTVKQRLFSARNTVRKEVETMDERVLSLKPITMDFFGSGSVSGNDPFVNATRTFSQNLIYACRNTPKSVKELSEELCVPCLYVEEELDIQLRGVNGVYGTLRKQGTKYVSNVVIAEERDRVRGAEIYKKYTDGFCEILGAYLKENEKWFTEFPFLNGPRDMSDLLWVLIFGAVWGFIREVEKIMDATAFSQIDEAVTTSGRKYTFGVVARKREETASRTYGYGCDGNSAKNLCGYSLVEFSNIYGPRIEAHYRCGYNLSHDEVIALLLSSIGGLALDALSETEKEVAAKGVEAGLLRKNGTILEPAVLIVEAKRADALNALLDGLYVRLAPCCEALAEEVADFIKKHIQKHLLDEYKTYNMLLSSAFTNDVVDKCIETGLLKEPKSRKGPEGVLVRVKK